jgi:hypothetical protein
MSVHILIAVNILCLFALGWRAWHLEGKLADAARADASQNEAISNLASDLWSSRSEAAALREENRLLNRRNVQITNELRGSDDRALTVALPDLKPSPVQWTPDPGQRTFP